MRAGQFIGLPARLRGINLYRIPDEKCWMIAIEEDKEGFGHFIRLYDDGRGETTYVRRGRGDEVFDFRRADNHQQTERKD